MTPYAVVSPDGRIVRMGLTEISMVAMQATEPGDVVIAPLDEPSFGVIIAAIPPEVSDETHAWDFTNSEWDLLPARPSEPHYWDGNQFVVYPPQPNGFCFWDGTEWIDPRTEADYLGALHAARLATFLPPSEVILRLVSYGAYPSSEIANSFIPATFDAFLAQTAFDTGTLRNDIRAGLTHWAMIPRSHSMLHGPIHPDDPGDGLPNLSDWLATDRSVTITPAQWDEIFEVQLPPPLYVSP